MQKSGWALRGLFSLVFVLWAFPAWASCRTGASGYSHLLVTISFGIALGFFIRALFFIFRGAKKKGLTFKKALPRTSVYLILCVLFACAKFSIYYFGEPINRNLSAVFGSPQGALPCCNARGADLVEIPSECPCRRCHS